MLAIMEVPICRFPLVACRHMEHQWKLLCAKSYLPNLILANQKPIIINNLLKLLKEVPQRGETESQNQIQE